MNLKDLFEMCSIICDKDPSAHLFYKDEKVPYTKIKEELNSIRDWCYPIESNNIKKCVLCKDCKHYKSYTSARSKKYRCELDSMPKAPEHYCGYGEEV